MTCGRFGHKTRDHHNASTGESANDEGSGGNCYNANKRPRREANNAGSSIVEVNTAKQEEHIAFIANVANVNNMDMDNNTYDNTEYYNFEHVPSSIELDLHLIYYEWLADSGATLHITYRCDTFKTYKLIPEIPISGVGGAKVHVIGQGSIKLMSECNKCTYILELQNVLHVPNNKNNLLSLGKWERDGQSYNACDGALSLLMKEKKPVANSVKISNNLYKFTFKHTPRMSHSDYVFSTANPSQSWETWH